MVSKHGNSSRRRTGAVGLNAGVPHSQRSIGSNGRSSRASERSKLKSHRRTAHERRNERDRPNRMIPGVGNVERTAVAPDGTGFLKARRFSNSVFSSEKRVASRKVCHLSGRLVDTPDGVTERDIEITVITPKAAAPEILVGDGSNERT